VRRNRPGEARFVWRIAARATGLGLLLTVVGYSAGGFIDDLPKRQPLPEGYGFRYGENPFAPSLARTDWLWRVEQDRAWAALADKLSKNEAESEELRMFLEQAEGVHRADELCRSRGERHMDVLGGFEADRARIALLRAVGTADAGTRDAAILEFSKRTHADLARTEKEFGETAGLHPDSLSGSRSCGTTGCHEEILAEWEPSAHRYASRSAFFQLIQGAMAEANGAESTRYCAGCHDPIALFSGAKNLYDEDLSSPGADEGISCIACHRIVRTDVQGNANYTLSPPSRYLAEDSFLGRFLIRAYPRRHRVDYMRPLLDTPEFCGACHKQFIDEDLNRAGRVQLQNQYDAWRGSHWFVPDEKDPNRADDEKTLACRDCHMRLVDSLDPAAISRDGKHRHHGYIAANQWLPELHKLPHAEKHVRLTEEWLKGETVIPEIADRWPAGPPVPLVLEVPDSAKPGESIRIRVVADNRKVGHSFPTGPLDVIQAWIDVRVTQGDREIFRSGALDERGFLKPGAFQLKAEGVDRAGHLIDRHNLWDMVGARFRRVLFPGYADQEQYTFEFACSEPAKIPGSEAEFVAPESLDDLVVTATLRYRKVDQTLLNLMDPSGKSRAPVTDMTTVHKRIKVISP